MRDLAVVVRVVASNRRLLRVVLSYGLFITTEYAVWISMLVYAYLRGGAKEAGLVAIAQLLPGAFVAPLISTVADRHPPVRLLTISYLGQGTGMIVAALLIWTDGPVLLIYAAAVVASTAIVAVRPAQAPLVPALATSTTDLTAANIALGWIESVAVVLAGALTGLMLAFADVAVVFLVSAVLVASALLLVLPLRTVPLSAEPDETPALRSVVASVRLLSRSPRPRLLVSLLTAQDIVIGAMDVLFVIIAINVLSKGEDWAGYLNSAFGLGGVVVGAAAASLLGRKLGGPIILTGVAVSVALAAAAFVHEATTMILVIVALGAARSVFDISTRSLLQRAVPADVLGRVFGLVEGLAMAGYAAGNALVAALMAVGGSKAALLGVACVIPLVGAIGVRALIRLDAEATVPVVEIALLRSLPIFTDLPAPASEGLARSMERVEVVDGTVLMREGEPGDRYYAIGQGTVSIERGGRDLGTRTRGDGVGEIALLRSLPRTATVTAAGPVTLYVLERDDFLTAVTGHRPTSHAAETVAEQRLHDDDPSAF